MIDNVGQTADVNVTATSFDEYDYSYSSVLELKTAPSDINVDPFVFSGENATTYTSGTVSVELFKASNGRLDSATTQQIVIQSYGVIPNITLGQTVFKSSPGGKVYNFNISSNEPLTSLSIVSASEPTVTLGSVTKNNDTHSRFL